MSLILENLKFSPNTFLYNLIDDGLFNKNQFQDLILFIDNLNKSDINKNERLELSNKIWELGNSIQSSLVNSLNDNDGYKINNLDNNQIRQLSLMIGYLCKSFSDNSVIEKDLFEFDKE